MSFSKLPALILLSISTFVSFSCSSTRNGCSDIHLEYLFMKGYGKSYAVYRDGKEIAEPDCLKNRSRLDIRFSEDEVDSLVFAEKDGNIYRVKRLDYVRNEETVLFCFERETGTYRAFTEHSLFWYEKGKESNDPYILYEYDSRTNEVKKLNEAEVLYDESRKGYACAIIGDVYADEHSVFFTVEGFYNKNTGSFVLDRSTGDVRKTDIPAGWFKAGRYGNKVIREGSKVVKNDDFTYYEADGKSCVITDLDTLKDMKYKFSKRYERQAGPLILLSDEYFLVPLCITPIKDTFRNGLFMSNWTVCYSVFDTVKNKVVFNGLETETKIMSIIDARLIAAE